MNLRSALLLPILSLLVFVLNANSQIQHVVTIIKENHSFDNYFGLFPGANGVSCGNTPTQVCHPLSQMTDTPVGCTHSLTNAIKDIDSGKMDGFYQECGNNYNGFVQAQQSLIPNYWAYAQTYGLADNFFTMNLGPSFPTHTFDFSESANNAVGQPVHGPGGALYGNGCDNAAKGGVVNSIDPTTGKSYYQPSCFNLKTMGDVLDAAGVSWKIYAPQPGRAGYQWNVGSYYSNLWYGTQRAKDVPDTQFCTDVANGQLPAVSRITTQEGWNEHPPSSITNGENWTVEQVNCVMNSPYWNSTLIVIYWDDWGGFYDHVAPPVESYFGYGLRVPLLVISPYVKPGYVGHMLYSSDSINKEVEELFNTGCLLTDCSAAVNDLSDMLTLAPITPALVLSPRSHVKQDEKLVRHLVDEDADD